MSHLSNFCGEKAHSRQQINDAPFERETSNDKIGIAEVIPGSALQLPSSFRLTGNPHLTRRWPFGRVTEGLPTIRPQASESSIASESQN